MTFAHWWTNSPNRAKPKPNASSLFLNSTTIEQRWNNVWRQYRAEARPTACSPSEITGCSVVKAELPRISPCSAILQLGQLAFSVIVHTHLQILFNTRQQHFGGVEFLPATRFYLSWYPVWVSPSGVIPWGRGCLNRLRSTIASWICR